MLITSQSEQLWISELSIHGLLSVPSTHCDLKYVNKLFDSSLKIWSQISLPFLKLGKKNFFIDIQLIYKIILVSGIQHSESILLQITFCLKLLQNNSLIFLCCILSLFIIYFIHSSLYLLVLFLYLTRPLFPHPTGNHWFILCVQ